MTTNLLRSGASGARLEAEFARGLLDRIKERFPTIETRKGLSVDEFNREYREHRRPVLMQGCMDWPALTKWSFDYLAQRCASAPVTIDVTSTERSTKTTFGEFVTRAKQNTGTPLYLQGWFFKNSCPELEEDLGTLEFEAYNFIPRLYGEGLRTRLLWIGQKGAVTAMHQDANYVDVIHGQLHGRKQWCVFGPETVLGEGPDGQPDFATLLDSDAEIRHVIAEPGDVLYLPAQWWHRASLLEDCIGLGMQALDERNVPKHMRARHQELLPMILNAEQIKRTYPDLYQISKDKLAGMAKLFDIDLTRIR